MRYRSESTREPMSTAAFVAGMCPEKLPAAHAYGLMVFTDCSSAAVCVMVFAMAGLTDAQVAAELEKEAVSMQTVDRVA